MINSTDGTFPLETNPATVQVPHTPNQSPQPDPDKPAWGLGSALFVWIASVFLIVLMPVLFLVPYAMSRGLSTSSPDYVKALAELALNDKTAVLLQVLALLPTHILTFALIWAVVTRFGKQRFWPAIGWRSSGYVEVLFWGALGVLLFGIGALLAFLFGSAKPTQLEQIINSSLAARYAISILAVGTAPFVEEFMYRGVLYAPLQKLAGAPVAVCLVLALFTIIHVPQYWPNYGAIAAVATLSIALTFVRAYTHRLLPCIIIHLVFNGIQAAILLVEPYAQRIAPSSEPVNPTIILWSLANLLR
ncbi:MAG TPA: CPBP family intramembrane glutamic endopeptidase [Pyrinomonadaceae bacterium]|nr:CPBP family intramembrane glutamic endopeptidase [Pyrinomonadaceae bacterium]